MRRNREKETRWNGVKQMRRGEMYGRKQKEKKGNTEDSLFSKVHCCCLDTRSHVAQLCQKLAEAKDYGDLELLIFWVSPLELWIFRCVHHDVSF